VSNFARRFFGLGCEPSHLRKSGLVRVSVTNRRPRAFLPMSSLVPYG
jgi:hypothetical protein